VLCLFQSRPDTISAGRRLATDRRGVSALEMALLAPILLLLLTGIAQFGAIYVLQNNMQNTARELALRLATADLLPGQAQAWASQRLPRRIDGYVVAVELADDVFKVTIRAPLRQAVPIDPLAFFATGELSVRASAREMDL